MSTFENGWICKVCWKSNREQDIRCYRCKSLHPDYHEVTEAPRTRQPRAPRRPVIQPLFARAGAGVNRAASALAVAVGAVGNGVARMGRIGASSAVRILRAARAVAIAPAVILLRTAQFGAARVQSGARSVATRAVGGMRTLRGSATAAGRVSSSVAISSKRMLVTAVHPLAMLPRRLRLRNRPPNEQAGRIHSGW